MTQARRARVPMALRLGIFGALGFAAWLGFPLIGAIANDTSGGQAMHWIEVVIAGLLVGFALFAARRFAKQRGWVVGPVLLVALIVEVAKRLAVLGPASLGTADAVIVVLIFFCLLIGIRAARATRTAALL